MDTKASSGRSYSTNSTRVKRRLSGGQALVEGAVTLAIFTAAVILYGGFLLAVGQTLFYKEKVAFLTGAAANFAAVQPLSAADIQQRTQTFVNAAVTPLGLAGATLRVENVNRNPANQLISVTIHAENLPFVNIAQGVLPDFTTITDTEVATMPFVGAVRLNLKARLAGGASPIPVQADGSRQVAFVVPVLNRFLVNGDLIEYAGEQIQFPNPITVGLSREAGSTINGVFFQNF
jgi:hypothetical protein